MDGFANGAEMMACPNCGADMRRGMVRCRECGQSAKETEGDFELTGNALQQAPKCPRCGSFLEPGVTDCAVCASQMLDQLMSGPPSSEPVPSPHVAGERPMSIMEQRVRQAALAGAAERESTSEFDTVADTSPTRVRSQTSVPAAGRGAAVTEPAMNPAPSPKGPARTQTPADRSEKPVAPAAAAATPAAKPSLDVPEAEDEEATVATVETSPACAALLASLAKADTTLRCEIATALGKLGDKAALVPLERHMVDKDIRVRRAVATALVQLGHPKGETLLGIAERMPAASVLKLANAPVPKAKKSSGGGITIDPQSLIKVGGGLLAAALIGGGIWMWMSSSPSPRGRGKKAKAVAAKKVTPSKAKAAKKPAPTDD
jgi:hypothetical protein